VGARVTVARAGGLLRPPLVRRLTHSVIALPPARRTVAERGLMLVPPPDEFAITRGVAVWPQRHLS
jgi:hypothetical protein